jgi:peroxiredoxin
MFRYLLCLIAYCSAGWGQDPRTSVPLLANCWDAGEIKATIRTSDPIQVQYRLSGGAQMCFAVSATVNGTIVQGFLLGTGHPAVVAFDRESRIPAPAVAPQPPPALEAVRAGKDPVAGPASFAGLKGVDMTGRPINLSSIRAKNVVLYFWSTTDRHSIKDAELLDYVYEQYHPQGVEIVGIAKTPDLNKLRQICQQNEAIWPQIVDSGRLAGQYHVNPAKPYFVLDQKRHVVASLSSAAQLEAVLQGQLERQ